MSDTSQLLEELSEFCRSDSLSEGGLRGIIEKHGIIALNNNITNYKFFHDACRNERVTEGILRYLLEYFPNAVRDIDEEGWLPLHYICRNKNVTLGMVQLLIDAFPESVRHENNKGHTPLHALCCNNNLDDEVAVGILKLLLEKCPESIRHATRIGNLPIHPAAALQSPEFCRILIEAHPGSERMTNDIGGIPFHAACQSNTVATVKYLHHLYPESINMVDNDGYHPIHYAIIWGICGLRRRSNPIDGIELVKFLLDCNPDALSSTGETPLHIACGNKFVTLKIVQLLINAFPESLRHQDSNGLMPLHKLCLNNNLDEDVAVEILKLLIEKCPEAVKHATRKGNLPIQIAVANQSPEFCRLLIEAYPGSERMTSGNGWLPFHYACQCNTVATLEYLYQLYPESINVADRNGHHPIHHAIMGLKRRSNPKDGIDVVRFLLGCNPDALSSTGQIPLHIACINKHVTLNIVRALIDAFPESLRHQDSNGLMPLHKLCQNNNLDEDVAVEILKLLVEKCPEAVKHATRKGNLPIHIAAEKQSPEFCRLLIEAYPGSERMTNDIGGIPFHYACQCNTVATLEYLYQLYPESINVADNHGRYPIHLAAASPKHRKDSCESSIEMVQFLLDCNPDVVLQKFRDKLPLYWVCAWATNDNTRRLNARLGILQILYDAHPEAIDEVTSDVGSFCQEIQTFINNQLSYARQARDLRQMNTSDENGQLPLHKTLRDNATVTLGSIKLLIKGNPSAICTFDNRGTIPLHVACQYHESPAVVQYLIGLNKITLTTADREGNTVLHYACLGGNHAIIALLLNKYGSMSVSNRNANNQLPIDLLFESEAVSDRNDVKYVESIYRLLRSYPETLMNSNSDMNMRRQATSNDGKKRKFSDL